jgi:hypothetical protein
MNATRRKALTALNEKLDALKCEAEELAREEREYYDNMPESLQGGEKGEAADEAATNLESAVENLQETIDNIGSTIGE